ncbi:phosphotransferase [Paenibacillus sp. SYP-B3998]|uniref:Phosphotransferase n=1 Tax=Paenibacillus sp. SYP-B3998 TaxID=2678564 RepID=A0A6G3ZVK5_9BACL|nr:phosphotransferase [Paenibacillus sp. SYP-B3998]NEW05734.1 phosphotransferase [Paenibacillus sp. SYP-B3998]
MPIINDIEEAYPVTIRKSKKIRDVYRLVTMKGRMLCSKSYDIPEPEVHFIARVMIHLAETGFPYGPRIISTKTQALWATRKEKPYMITNWVWGRSPDFKERSEWKKAIRTLAKFHRHAEGITLDDIPAGRDRYATLQNTIEHYRINISEHQGIGDISTFISLCDQAIHYLNQPKSIEAINYEASVRAFVHGDYNYPNLVMDRKDSIHLIDFENTSLQARMADLAHVLHRNCSWNGEEMVRWVEYYDRKRPLSSEDRHLLFALLHVPYPLVRTIRLNKNDSIIKNTMPQNTIIDKYVNALKIMI